MKWTRRVLAIFAVVALGFGAGACGSDPDPAPEGESEPGLSTTGSASPDEGASGATLEGTAWELMNIGSTEGWATSLPSNLEPPTLTIEDGRAEVFTGCNSGAGEVELTDTTIEFVTVGLTEKACDEAASQTEQLVSDFLEGEVRYSMNPDGNLVLEKNTYSLVFIPASD